MDFMRPMEILAMVPEMQKVRILEFAEAMGYVVTSTLFKKRQSHLVTYESGGNKTAVDMILIKGEHKKRIMNTKVIPCR